MSLRKHLAKLIFGITILNLLFSYTTLAGDGGGKTPIANFTFSITEKTINFTNTSTNTISWDWDFGDGSSHSADLNPVHTYANFGTYTVTLVATDASSKTNTISKSIDLQNAAGVVRQWPLTTSANDKALTNGSSDSNFYPFLTRTSDGGYFIAWESYAENNNIIGKKIDSAGNELWSVNIATGSAVQPSYLALSKLQLVADSSGGAYVGYIESSGGSYEAQQAKIAHINNSGSVTWTSSSLNTGVSPSNNIKLITDGSGGVYAAWLEIIDSNNSQYHVSRYNSSGSVVAGWPEIVPQRVPSGSPLIRRSSEGQLVPTANGFIFVNFDEISTDTGSSKVVLAHKYSNNGATQWSEIEFKMLAHSFSAITDGSNGVIVFTTYTPMGGKPFIKAERVDTNGLFTYSTAGNLGEGLLIKDYTSSSVTSIGSIQAAPSGAGGAVLGWREGSDYATPYVQKTNSEGLVQWGTDGISLGLDVSYNSTNLNNIISDGAGGAIVSLSNNDNGVTYTGIVQRIKSDRTRDWGYNGYTFSSDTPGNDYHSNIVYDGNNGAIAVWDSPINSIQEIFVQDFRSGVTQGGNSGNGSTGTGEGMVVIDCGNLPQMDVPSNLQFDSDLNTAGIQNAFISGNEQTTHATQPSIKITDSRTNESSCNGGNTPVTLTVKVNSITDNFCRIADGANPLTCDTDPDEGGPLLGDQKLVNEVGVFSSLSFIGTSATNCTNCGYYSNSINLSTAKSDLTNTNSDVPGTAITLFSNPTGFNGVANLPALDYSLLIPPNSPAGTFKAVITYELTYT